MGILRPAKPLASLSSGLLARKGQARPAMRPQGFASMTGSPVSPGDRLDDLGWNDMGEYDRGNQDRAGAGAGAVPSVLVEREALVRGIEAPVATAPAPSVEPQPAIPPTISSTIPDGVAARIARDRADQATKGKAAFTLRLDAERHVRLRLASAVAHRSAQALVVDALDRFLTTMPEVEALVAHLPHTPLSKVSR